MTNPESDADWGDPPRISSAAPLSLEYVLARIGRSPEALSAAAKIAAAVSRHVGNAAGESELARHIQDPRLVAKYFSPSVPDLARGFAAAREARLRPRVEKAESSRRLPRHVEWRRAPACLGDSSWKPRKLVGNLYSYAIPSPLSTVEVQTRIAFGEILDRLAANRSAEDEDRFSVLYLNTEYTDFDAFVDALVESGHQVEMDVSNEVSDFMHLMLRQSDGTLRELQTDIRIRTGYRTAEGEEIIVPAVHSHLIFRVAGPQVNTAVEFYQGVAGVHFHPSLLVQGESWVGIRTSATYRGPPALKALSAAGLYLDLLLNLSRKDALFAEGYGNSGICNDSVAVIELVIGEEASVYPLLINKPFVLNHVADLQRQRPQLAERYGEIRRAIEQMPSDIASDESQPRRILACIPYGPGRTPHTGYNDARHTFGK